MKYILQLPGFSQCSIPTQIHDESAGLIILQEMEVLALDKNLTPELQWIEFAITCATSVSLSVLANVIYDHVFKRQGKVLEKTSTEVSIELPDGTVVYIREKRTLTE